MASYIIFGNTHFAERIYKHIYQEGVHNVIAFTQESRFMQQKELCGLSVVPFEDLRSTIKEDFSIIIAIGYSNMNKVRSSIYDLVKSHEFAVGSYVSSNSSVYSEVSEGTLVFPGTMIGTDVKMGKCNVFEPCVLMGHDNNIGDFNFFAGGSTFGGYVNIGSNCFVGMNATLKNEISIADYTLVGQSSNVLKSVNCAYSVVAGNPAKLFEKSSLGAKI